MAFQNFYDLEVYKACRQLRNDCLILIKTRFPPTEKYRLSDQLRRSSRSITNQIAEGHGRYHIKENIQFCRIGRGSLSESLDHIIVAYDEKYISLSDLKLFKSKYDKCLKLLNGYISYLKKQLSMQRKS